MTTDVNPPEPVVEDEPEPMPPGDDDAPSSRTVPAGALVVAIMVAAALGILAVVALTVGGSGGDSDQEAARLAAGRFSERFLTFQHDGLDQWKADVLALSTGGFSNEVDNVEEGLRRLIDQAQLDATAQVTDIFMGEVDKGAVSAVVVYDRDLSGTSGKRTETNRYMQLSLVSVDGEWLVDNVIDIATAQSPTGPTTGASTTTTTPTSPSTSTTAAPSG